MRSVLMTILMVALLTPTLTQADTVCSYRLHTARSPFGPIPWVNRGGALQAAIGAWEGGVSTSARYLTIMAVWSQARMRKEACSRQPNGVGGYNWSCEIVGQPCAPVASCNNYQNRKGLVCN